MVEDKETLEEVLADYKSFFSGLIQEDGIDGEIS
jgi:hypothetical protein